MRGSVIQRFVCLRHRLSVNLIWLRHGGRPWSPTDSLSVNLLSPVRSCSSGGIAILHQRHLSVGLASHRVQPCEHATAPGVGSSLDPRRCSRWGTTHACQQMSIPAVQTGNSSMNSSVDPASNQRELRLATTKTHP